ncbi:MAG: transglycosylase SLT domain-containing protein [Pyrinomonadaceae bacterium]|nr:transglycosylase SLT domain-containing protein [Pyrinomonadaceae bacterium]
MKTSIPRLIACALILFALIAPTAVINAQTSGSSARYISNEVEKLDGRVTQVINKAEDHFRKGKLNLDDSKREQARDEFDKAVDSVLESGMDVRASNRLQTFYLELIERIYRLEVPQQQITPQSHSPFTQVAQTSPSTTGNGRLQVQDGGQQDPHQVGFREQKFEPSPLDELSKLVLDPEEQNVSPGALSDLELAKNAVDFGFNTNPLIQQYINYYQGRGRSTMENGIRRSGQFMKMARKIFREEGVPEDIVWLGQVESSWRPRAQSWAAASGLWQFIPGTGSRFGLRQTAWVDERNGYEKATRASAKYLKFLANRYNGNWELAMAAYNTGEGNIDRAISRAGSSNFWVIYPYIAQETRNYVPNILATILIAKNPDKYGFKNIRPDAPLSYDVVEVQGATSLQLIADATDTSVDYIRSLNPELRRDITPRGERYHLRVPAGRSKQFVAVLKRIPSDRRESARVISITPGEDLQAVANRTGLSVAQIQAMNGGADLSATNKLVVPNNSVRNVALVRAKSSATSSLKSVKAGKGDTVAKIAARYNVAADELAKLNGVPSVDAELAAGREIKMPSTATNNTNSRSRRRSGR